MKKDKLFLENPRFHKFTFNDQVAEIFDDMISRSVPFYDEIHAIILDLVDYYYKKNELIYDLGRSTGTTINLLHNHLLKKKISHFIEGIDNSKSMINKCQIKLKNKKIGLNYDDIINFELKNCQIVI